MKVFLSQFEDKMKSTVSFYSDELKTVRAGRANPSILDKITVPYYGVDTPLNQIAGISVPEARIIAIQPWDVSIIKEIEKAIQRADLGINPSNDGKIIRLVIPALTTERREELTKHVSKLGENSKVAIRNIRRDAMDQIKKLEKSSEITEDEKRRYEDATQDLTDKYIEEIDEVTAKKQEEIMEI